MPSSKNGQDIGTLLIEGVREALEHKRGEILHARRRAAAG